MCGRYYFKWMNNTVWNELRRRVEQYALFEYAKEEVFPTQNALVLIAERNSYRPVIMKWGMEILQKHLVINARIESLMERKMFREDYKQRCLIPCNGFYEWIDGANGKLKVLIAKKDQELIYLAGFHNMRQEFVILTANSENEMRSIHNRTPLIIAEDKLEAFLHQKINSMVDNNNLSIQRMQVHQKYKQLTLLKDLEV